MLLASVALLAFLLVASLTAHAKETGPDDLPGPVTRAHAAAIAQGCDGWANLDLRPEAFELGDGDVLYVIPCLQAAYNVSYRLYLVRDGALRMLGPEVSTAGTDDVWNVGYDSAEDVLSTSFLYRGLGDCGVFRRYRYVDGTFELQEERAQPECDGKQPYPDWPVVFSK